MAVVAAITESMALTEFITRLDELTAQHGDGLRVRNYASAYLIVDGPTPELDCPCRACETKAIKALAPFGLRPPVVFRVCPACGDKRCPHCADHNEACTAPAN